jgi:predicted RecB family nuclease
MRIDKWPLDVHEITALRSLGVSSVPELAAADVEELLPGYEARVAHRQGIDDRLRAAARRARLMESGIELERVATGSVPVPAAALEIDLDIEASADNRVYLWGFLVHDTAVGASPYYRPFAAFESLSQEQEAELAIEAFGWLRAKVEEKDSLVFHYSDYEVVRLAQIAAGSEGLDWAMGFAGTRFVDLFTIVKQNFFGVHGLGLKNVAHTGAGFSWRDPDPGGLNSQAWFEDALRGPARGRLASRQRILAYNEDDVRATWQLRQWLRTLT